MTIAHQPFGKALLIAMAVGLAGYAMWRSIRAGIGLMVAIVSVVLAPMLWSSRRL